MRCVVAAFGSGLHILGFCTDAALHSSACLRRWLQVESWPLTWVMGVLTIAYLGQKLGLEIVMSRFTYLIVGVAVLTSSCAHTPQITLGYYPSHATVDLAVNRTFACDPTDKKIFEVVTVEFQPKYRAQGQWHTFPIHEWSYQHLVDRSSIHAISGRQASCLRRRFQAGLGGLISSLSRIGMSSAFR